MKIQNLKMEANELNAPNFLDNLKKYTYICQLTKNR